MKKHVECWENGNTPSPKDWEVTSIKPDLPVSHRKNEAQMRVQYIAIAYMLFNAILTCT